MKPREKGKNLLYLLFPVLGVAFFLWYIYKAGGDAVYSDYIRIIDSYLPDVTDTSKLFTPDVLTRVPAYFMQRIVNIRSFRFSVQFDRVCTIFGIALMAGTVARFAIRRRIPFWSYIASMIVLFSLTKWEILMNGTCWPHMVAIGLFFVNYAAFDEIWQGEADGMTEFIACLMPLLWLLFAGEYIASYCVTMILLAGFGVLTGGAVKVVGRKVQYVFIRILVMTVVALALYMVSRSFAEWEHAGSTDMTLMELIRYAPTFLPRFFAKSFTGAVIGVETANTLIGGQPLPDAVILGIGIIMVLAYVVALILYFTNGMNEVSVFPLCLLVSGFLNHGVVTYARWIFLDENYGLSSRYAGQFMVGLIGLILIAGMYRKPKPHYRRRGNERLVAGVRCFLAGAILLVAAGNVITTVDEIRKAPYRKANYEQMEQAILNYRNMTPEELCKTLEWHKDPETLMNALQILEENGLNVFSPEL